MAEVARVDNAIRHRADRLFRQARAEGRHEPSEAYAYDAATALLTSKGDGEPVPAGADAKIIVRVDHTALTRGRCVEGETCEIAGIGPIPVTTVREWMGDAFLAAVLTRGDDVQQVVHLGRKFKATQRTALQWQNPICARKGCANRLGLEYDHFEDWATTHTTRVDAAKRFCHPCHQLKSRGWRVPNPTPTASAPSPHPTSKQSPTPPPPPCKPDAAGPEPPDPLPTPRHRVAAHARTLIGTVPDDGDLRGVGGAPRTTTMVDGLRLAVHDEGYGAGGHLPARLPVVVAGRRPAVRAPGAARRGS